MRLLACSHFGSESKLCVRSLPRAGPTRKPTMISANVRFMQENRNLIGGMGQRVNESCFRSVTGGRQVQMGKLRHATRACSFKCRMGSGRNAPDEPDSMQCKM